MTTPLISISFTSIPAKIGNIMRRNLPFVCWKADQENIDI
jgi:hypothetical protein